MRVLFAIKLCAVYVILAMLKVLKLLLLALPCSIFIASALACVTAIRTLGKLFNQSFHNFICILEWDISIFTRFRRHHSRDYIYSLLHSETLQPTSLERAVLQLQNSTTIATRKFAGRGRACVYICLLWQFMQFTRLNRHLNCVILSNNCFTSSSQVHTSQLASTCMG